MATKLKEKDLETAEKPAKPEKPKETTPEFIASMASVLVVGLFIITFCLQAFEIPSGSMKDTLLIGDHLFVDRVTPAPKTSWMPLVPYRQVHRNDIMVFVSPAQPGMYLVKRIVGVPGDRLHLKDNVLYRNGQKLDESAYVKHDGSIEPYRDNFPSIPPSFQVTPEWHVLLRQNIEGEDLVVPPDRYFAMGDNRDQSYDSRYWGFVPQENIIGRPMFIYWSFVTPELQYEKTSIGDRLGFIGHIVLHFFTETRWSRMLRLVH